MGRTQKRQSYFNTPSIQHSITPIFQFPVFNSITPCGAASRWLAELCSSKFAVTAGFGNGFVRVATQLARASEQPFHAQVHVQSWPNVLKNNCACGPEELRTSEKFGSACCSKYCFCFCN